MRDSSTASQSMPHQGPIKEFHVNTRTIAIIALAIAVILVLVLFVFNR